MENTKMKKQTYQQQKTHGKTTNRISNKDMKEEDVNKSNTLRLVSLTNKYAQSQRYLLLTKLDDDP